MIPRPPRHKRPVRFNRNRANPIQRLPFYRPSLARVGDYWRMPEAQGYLMNREVGRLCAVAFVQAMSAALRSPDHAESAHLSDLVKSAIEANGGSITTSQRGLLDGFFGRDSVLTQVLELGIKAAPGLSSGYTMLQLEGALTDIVAMGPEEYALRRPVPLSEIVPERLDRPDFQLEPSANL